MSSLSKYQTVRNVLILFIPLLYIAVGTMLSVFSSKVPFIDWIRLLLSISGLTLMFWELVRRRMYNIFYTLVWFALLILLTTYNYYFIERPPIAHSYLDLGDSVLWISIFYLSYRVAYGGTNAVEISKLVAYMAPIFTLLFLNVRTYFLINTEDTALISTAYYSLFLLPFILLIKHKYIKWILVLCVFMAVLLSSKRAGFLAFGTSILVYLFFELKQKKRSQKWLAVSGAVIALLCIFIFMNYFIQQNDLSIFDRLSRLGEDGGSGRDLVYEYTWGMITGSSFLATIFGHGFNTVSQDSALGLSAHTDTLEVLYDYGILGVALYITFFFKLYSGYKMVKVYRPEYVPSFAVSIVLVIFLSLFAHLIIYPSHFLFVCAFWGLCLGECRKIKIKSIVYGQ